MHPCGLTWIFRQDEYVHVRYHITRLCVVLYLALIIRFMKSNPGLRSSTVYSLKEFIFETLCSLNEGMSKSTSSTSGTNPTLPSNNVDQPETDVKPTPQSSAVKALDASMNSGVVAKKLEKITQSSGKPADQIAAVTTNVARSVVNGYREKDKLDKITPAELLRKLKQGADSMKDELRGLQDSIKDAEDVEKGDKTSLNKQAGGSKNPLLTPTK